MSDKDFIVNKLNLMKLDKQATFDKLVEPLEKLAGKVEVGRTVEVPADGNWFRVSFNAVEVKQNRLVISAKRISNGMGVNPRNPAEKLYMVDFEDTRAAYLRAFYEQHHSQYGWPYIYWDIRSYTKHPSYSDARVYVNGFIAHDELRKMIYAMESMYGTSNILNNYIRDNLFRFQSGINAGKTPQEIEKAWSKGLMESLGYHYVEAFELGRTKGVWKEAKVHWCKRKQDLRG